MSVAKRMKMLILSGTGILGRGIAHAALGQRKYEVTSVGHERTIPKKGWDVVVDVYASDMRSLSYEAKHTFIISTTLVYDRSELSFSRITEQHPLATGQGGYVDEKLAVEHAWKTKRRPWTILRPFHLLGQYSHLGCCPWHNRDPELKEHMKKGKITLADGGRIPLNITHPQDIGRVIVEAALNPETYHKVYNTVNPKEVLARDYYEEIARQLGRKVKIVAKPSDEAWKQNEWVLTTLPHLYDTSALQKAIGYVPDTPLEKCVEDALRFPAEKMEKKKTRVYQHMHLLPKPKEHHSFRI